MKVAIVDDDKQARKDVLEMIRRYVELREIKKTADTIRYVEFDSAESFLGKYKPGLFDIVAMDIYMDSRNEKLNGIETVRQLRLNGDDIPVIFITSSMEHILEGYQVFASGYIIKPVKEHEKEIINCFDHCLKEYLSRSNKVTFRTKENNINIALSDIIYIEYNAEHKIVVHINSNVSPILETKMGFNECKNLLSDERFIECYHKLLLNMDYVEQMDKEDFVLSDGTVIPISRRKKDQVKQQYTEYILNK